MRLMIVMYLPRQMNKLYNKWLEEDQDEKHLPLWMKNEMRACLKS
jgi:hypothetical protein